MSIVVLRAESPTLDVEALLAAHPDLPTDAVWRAGDRGLRGRKLEASGFCLLLSEDRPWPETLEAVLARLERLGGLLADLGSAGVEAWVDFGLMVGTRDSFIGVAAFSPQDLAQFARMGVAVVVTAYPAHDDDPDTATTAEES